jgi:hypothetical protein
MTTCPKCTGPLVKKEDFIVTPNGGRACRTCTVASKATKPLKRVKDAHN